MTRILSRAARRFLGRRGTPTLEIHIPVSPTPMFMNMIHCFALSLRRFGGAYRDAPIILTVGDATSDPNLQHRHPWLDRRGVEVRWVPEADFRRHSYFATGAARFAHPYRSDVVLFLDADILVARPFDELIRDVHREQAVAGMIAPASPLQFFDQPTTWQMIYEHCGLDQQAELRHEHTGWPYYFSGDEAYRACPPYFNYGVVCAPSDVMRRLGDLYFPYLLRLGDLANTDLKAQIALTLAIVKLGVPTKILPVRYNFPNHPMLEALHGPELPSAKFLHLKEDHQIHKNRLFADVDSIRAALRRTDLRGINRIAQGILKAIESDLIDDQRNRAA